MINGLYYHKNNFARKIIKFIVIFKKLFIIITKTQIFNKIKKQKLCMK